MVARVSLLALMLLVSGCVYVPPVWEGAHAIDQLEFIEPGVTTKDEVVAKFGQPAKTYEGTLWTYFVYKGYKSGGFIVFVYVPPVPGEADPSEWTVAIAFDENDVVTEVWTAEHEPSGATAGVPLEFPRDELTREAALRGQWRSLCQRAVAGDGEAGSALASHFRHGWQPVVKDLVKAYLWYTFASDRGYSSAIDYRTDLKSEMNSAEISRAEQLVADWEPDPAKCEMETMHSDG